MADAGAEETEEMVTIQSTNSLEMQKVKSASVSEAQHTQDPTTIVHIDKQDTTLKDNEGKTAANLEKDRDNSEDPPTVETGDDTEAQAAEAQAEKRKERARNASIHLQELGDQMTMREIDELEQKQRARLSPKLTQAQPPAAGSFLGENFKQGTDSIIQITPTSSFLKRNDAITTILIDEFNADSTIKEFETISISLPRSPMAALILMELLGVWTEMDQLTKAGVFCSILLTTVIQFVAAAALYFQKFFDRDFEYKYGNIDPVFNIVVMSFVVVYLAQDCAKLYKMYILLKHVTDKSPTISQENSNSIRGRTQATQQPSTIASSKTEHDKSQVKKRDVGILWFFIISNFLFYIFLLFYALLETLGRSVLADKLQVAIGVFFLLELDDWLYLITIEPLQVLEDSVFELKMRANKGSKKERFRSITRLFWAVFFITQMIITLLYVTGSLDLLTLGA